MFSHVVTLRRLAVAGVLLLAWAAPARAQVDLSGS